MGDVGGMIKIDLRQTGCEGTDGFNWLLIRSNGKL